MEVYAIVVKYKGHFQFIYGVYKSQDTAYDIKNALTAENFDSDYKFHVEYAGRLFLDKTDSD